MNTPKRRFERDSKIHRAASNWEVLRVNTLLWIRKLEFGLF